MPNPRRIEDLPGWPVVIAFGLGWAVVLGLTLWMLSGIVKYLGAR